MVPPLPWKYYFKNEDDKIILANNQGKEECKLIESEKNLSEVNVLADVVQTKCRYTKDYCSKLPCIPRPPPKFMTKKERIKTPWDFFKSVFKGSL